MKTDTFLQVRAAGWATGLGRRLGGVQTLLGVGAVLVVAVLVRGWSLGAKPLWYDEAYSVFVAQQPVGEIFRLLRLYDTHLPLYHVFLHFWMGLFGKSEVVVRLPSLLASLGAVALTFLLGRRLAGDRVGLLAAALLALSPFQVTSAQEARMYPFLTLFGVGASYVLWLALEEGRRRHWIAYVGLMVLALYTHHFAFLLLAAQGIYVLGAHRTKAAVRGWLLALTAVAVAYLPLVPTLWTQLATARAFPGFQRPFALRALTELGGLLGFGGGLFGLGTYYRRGTLSIGYETAILIPFLLLALCGLVGLGKGRARAFVVSYWLLPIVTVTLIALKWDIFQERYFSFLLPPFAVLLAAGVVYLAGALRGQLRLVAPGAILVAVVLVNGAALRAVYQDQPFYNWRGAAKFVMAHAAADDFILYIPAYVGIPFEYYFHGSQARTDLSPDAVLSVAHLAARGRLRLRTSVPPDQMATIAGAHPRMWIIASVALGPQMRLRIAQALAPYFQETSGANFELVSTSLWESRLYGKTNER